jgi:hypothetical protein
MGNSITPMSTVLRPVGPRQPWLYWVRRLVLLAILVVVIVALAKACSGGGSSKQPDAKTPTTTPQSSSPPPTTQVSACDPSVLELELSTDATSYASGSPVKLIGTFTNPGATDCTLQKYAATEFWTVKSGPVKIWTTKGCAPADAVAKEVTIKAGGTKKVSVTWPGYRTGSTPCSTGPVAEAGEYTAGATLDGVKAPKAAIFHIT